MNVKPWGKSSSKAEGQDSLRSQCGPLKITLINIFISKQQFCSPGLGQRSQASWVWCPCLWLKSLLCNMMTKRVTEVQLELLIEGLKISSCVYLWGDMTDGHWIPELQSGPPGSGWTWAAPASCAPETAGHALPPGSGVSLGQRGRGRRK